WIRQGSADELTPTGVEKQLEAETGNNFVKTGDDPVTLVETDKPAPGVAATKDEDTKAATGKKDAAKK
ncbi:MAG: hypothetical protein ACTS5I_00890, partial [Rhodanobacter sp.]